MFQIEKGEKTARRHYQGRFELKGPRIGKKQLLKIFSELSCVTHLTFDAKRLLDSTEYCVKKTSRLDSP